MKLDYPVPRRDETVKETKFGVEVRPAPFEFLTLHLPAKVRKGPFLADILASVHSELYFFTIQTSSFKFKFILPVKGMTKQRSDTANQSRYAF